MVTVNVNELETRLSSLLAAIEGKDETIVICRAGRPIAELRPLSKICDPLRVHPELSQIEFYEDPMAPLEPEDCPNSDPSGIID